MLWNLLSSSASTSDYDADLVVMFSLDCKALRFLLRPRLRRWEKRSTTKLPPESNKPPNTPRYLKLGPKMTKA